MNAKTIEFESANGGHSGSGRRDLAWRPVIIGLLLFAPIVAHGQSPKQPPNDPPAETVQRPVILLTGFEPFKSGKPPNASWEGVRGLDGRDWNEYRLAARQLRVVWGSPMKELEAHIAKLKPAAIFSFGEGMAGSFALECKADNLRMAVFDNDRSLPPAVRIVDDGPPTFSASIPSQAIARALAEKGFAIRTSTAAGHYLCEENLYTLEYLRQRRHPDLNVAFCHVPPLGSRLPDRKVDSEHIEQFVLALLDAWRADLKSKAVAPLKLDDSMPKDEKNRQNPASASPVQ